MNNVSSVRVCYIEDELDWILDYLQMLRHV